MSSIASSPLAFGKLPSHGDFVRAGARSAAVDALDQWMQDGLSIAKRARALPAPGAAASPVYLIYSLPHVQEVLAGALVMSHDRVGRQYPLLVARAIDRRLLDPREVPYLPVVWADLLGSAARLAADAVQGMDQKELEQQLASLPGPADPRDLRARREHLERQQTMNARAFFESVWGDAEAGSKYILMKRLLEVVRPARGAAVPTCGLSFPLPGGGIAADAVAAWLEMVWRLWPRQTQLPVVAWPSAGERRQVIVFPQGPPRHSFAAVVGCPHDGRHIVTLDVAAGRATDAVLNLPPRYGRLLEQPDISLAALLTAL